ncbi:MAG TPA: carbohydrate binding domain-containing protein, partial [Actinopolymorphaceae bacterium]|nr:carbohydrate binding domain-containing protein [Actinopolymorphaceae bacterium]
MTYPRRSMLGAFLAFVLLASVVLVLNARATTVAWAGDRADGHGHGPGGGHVDATVLNGNPGFETGSLAPWENSNDSTVVANNAHSGTYALNLGTVFSGVTQTVSGLSPNTSYTLTGWVKTQADLIYLGVKNFAGSGTEVNTNTTSATYTKLSVSFTTGATDTSALLFLYKNDNAGTSYADDVELTATPTQSYSGQNVGFNTQDPYFQTQTSLNQLYDQVVGTGSKWVRATLFWDLMEPTQGNINWAQADMIFNTIKAHGLKYDMVIRSAPSWAAGGADTSDHNYAPTDNVSYGEICYQIAKRYMNRGVTITFELGNEQNLKFFNMPAVDPVQYTHNMLVPGYDGIHRAAGELGITAPPVVVGGFAPVDPIYVPDSMTPTNFMTAIYANGGGDHFDTIAYHTYTYVSAPGDGQWTFQELARIIDMMNSHGDTNRKIWATEVGWATGTGTGEISEADQAAWTAQEFDYWFSLPYAGPMIWYELVDNQSNDNNNRENTFGLMYNTQPWTPKPAYDAFLSKIAPSVR